MSLSKSKLSKLPNKFKGYAGVLPWTVDPKGNLHILLGREAGGPDKGKWSDFGGGVEPKDPSLLAAAFREMGEESMNLLTRDEADEDTKICPSLSFDFGSFHGTLVLGVLGKRNAKGRVSKDEWVHLQTIPSKLVDKRKAQCGDVKHNVKHNTTHNPRCEKDQAMWIRVKDILQVEQSLLLCKESIVPLRKRYGLILNKALQVLTLLK